MTRRTGSRTDPKGRILEEVVARLQQAGFQDVQTRVKFPSGREVDVLVTTPGPIQPLRVPFECKNLASKVGPRQIGKFRDKLEDIGLPVPYGIFVTTTGYTKGALRRAKELGIQILLVRGLTNDRLQIAVHGAMRSTVILFLSVHGIQPMSDTAGPGQFFEKTIPGAAFDQSLTLPDGSLPRIEHLLARLADLWCSGHIPRTLGTHGGVFRPPDGFKVSPAMEPLQSGVIWINLRVYGVVFPTSGTARATGLWDAASGIPAQLRLDLSFSGASPIRSELVFESEDELRDYLEGQNFGFQVVTRLAVPRVQFQHFWWPVSPQAVGRADALRSQGDALSFENVEMGSLTVGWAEDPRRLAEHSPPDDSQRA
jgi:hypothetical protein